MLSKAATTHCSSEPWMTCFALVQALLADLEILRQKCPYPDHPKEGVPGCRNIDFGQPRASTWAEDSNFSRTQASPLTFLLYASELKVLHSPPVLSGIPVRFILAPMLWRWSGHNETRGERALPFHEAPALHWSRAGYRSRAESRFRPIIFCLVWEMNCNSKAVPVWKWVTGYAYLQGFAPQGACVQLPFSECV